LQGVPDQTVQASAMLTYQNNYVFAAPSTVDWTISFRFFNDPTAPGSFLAQNMDSTNPASGTLVNATLADTLPNALTAWNSVERWRCCYYGVTVYLDAPAVANQGSIVVAQHPAIPVCYGHPMSASLYVLVPQLVRYQEGDTPAYATLMQMPNSFMGLAKDGAYIPLRLDSNHAVWHDHRDISVDATGQYWSPTSIQSAVPANHAATSGLYVVDSAYQSGGNWGGGLHLLPCTSGVASVSLQGLSKDATVRIVVRHGYEVQVLPGTAYAPFLRMAPGLDLQAVDTYYAVARSLKDSYPAEYNDLGKLWNVIKTIISKIAPAAIPVVESLPGGKAIVAVTRGIGQLGNIAMGTQKVRRRQKKPQKQTPPQLASAADKAEATKAVAAALAPVAAQAVRKGLKMTRPQAAGYAQASQGAARLRF